MLRNNTLIEVTTSVSEYFERANYKWRDKNDPLGKWFCEGKDDYGSETLEKTEKRDSFHGNFNSLYKAFREHKVEDGASMVDSVMGEMRSIDFDEVKWQFAQRLEEGDSIDVNRYLDGQDKFWSGVKRKRKTKKVVRIYNTFGGNCCRSERELAVNGAIGITLCEILESLGIGVEMWGCNLTNGVGHKYSILELVKLKSSEEFADLGIINYVLGNGKVFRNITFRNWIRTLAEHKDKSDYGLGHCAEATLQDLEGRDAEECDGTILVPPIYTIEEGKAWIMKLLKENEVITGDKK